MKHSPGRKFRAIELEICRWTPFNPQIRLTKIEPDQGTLRPPSRTVLPLQRSVKIGLARERRFRATRATFQKVSPTTTQNLARKLLFEKTHSPADMVKNVILRKTLVDFSTLIREKGNFHVQIRIPFITADTPQ